MMSNKMKKFENTYQDAALMRKAILNDLDDTESQEFEKRLTECPELRKIYAQLQNGALREDAFQEYAKYSSKKAYRKFLQEIEDTKQKRHTLRMRWSVAAAVVALVVALSFYVLNDVSSTVTERTLIPPGTQQAQLVLSDGRVVDMNETEVDVVADGVQMKYKEGVLSYQAVATESHEPQSLEEQPGISNELLIPRGGENTVILSDGTTVCLNAGTKLVYPVRFGGKRRVVRLEGEAYFNVTADAEHPFVVQTSVGDIIVHGTEFNVNAYGDSEVCYTTLVRGSVSCVNTLQQSAMLSPGEQAVFTADKLKKQPVNLEEHIGWVKGEYVFNNKSLEEIMKTFERWYDVSVYYDTPSLRKLTYSGNLKRNNSINTFLDALEITGDICYRINGRNILIYKNE